MRLLHLCLIVVFAAPVPAFAYEVINLSEEVEVRNQLGLGDFNKLEILSFEDNEKIGAGGQEAWTLLMKTKDEGQYYRVTVIWSEGEKRVVFMTPEKCNQEGAVSANAVMHVDGTAVSAFSLCGMSGDGLELAYWAKSERGRQFVLEAFADRRYVEVRFISKTIPFDASGFQSVLDSLGSAPPL